MSVSANSRVASFGPVVLALAFSLSAGSVPAADLDRGRALYDTHCRMCHESVAYRTKQKIAKTYVEARAQVVRWQTNISLQWSNEDIDNVASYLAKTYYKIPCPDC